MASATRLRASFAGPAVEADLLLSRLRGRPAAKAPWQSAGSRSGGLRHSALGSLRGSSQLQLQQRSSPYLAGLRGSAGLLHAAAGPGLAEKIRSSLCARARPSGEQLDFQNTLLRRLNRTGLRHSCFSSEQRKSLLKKLGPEAAAPRLPR